MYKFNRRIKIRTLFRWSQLGEDCTWDFFSSPRACYISVLRRFASISFSVGSFSRRQIWPRYFLYTSGDKRPSLQPSAPFCKQMLSCPMPFMWGIRKTNTKPRGRSTNGPNYLTRKQTEPLLRLVAEAPQVPHHHSPIRHE